MNFRSPAGRLRFQSGNVLFLTMIAIVLFVALAYAVMHMYQLRQNRGEDRRLKTNAVAMQYASAVRTGVTRMLLRDIPVDALDFSVPEQQRTEPPETAAYYVFNPAGGGVSYRPVTDTLVEQVDNDPEHFNAHRNGNWHFIRARIGGVMSDDKDLVAVLAGVREQVCKDMNSQITGAADIPAVDAPLAAVLEGKTAISGQAIDGQYFLCVRLQDAYAYYHILAEQ